MIAETKKGAFAGMLKEMKLKALPEVSALVLAIRSEKWEAVVNGDLAEAILTGGPLDLGDLEGELAAVLRGIVRRPPADQLVQQLKSTELVLAEMGAR